VAATTLSKIITIEQAVRPDAEAYWRTARALLSREALLTGHEITHEAADGYLQQPANTERVQVNVTEILAELQRKLTRYLDVTLTKDSGNTGTDGARADVVVDDQVVLSNVPATFLLFLDKRLVELQADLRKIPVQSAAEDWAPSSETGLWRTAAVAVPTTTKEKAFKVVVDPTDKFPADVREVSRDVVTGTRTTVKLTSAPEPKWLRAVLARVAALREAVQMAIHEANRTEVTDQKAGAAIFSFIFADGQ